MEEKITYFEKAGTGNTEETLRLAAERAAARGINKIVIASTRGETASLAAQKWAGTGLKMTVIPHQYGCMTRNQRFPAELVAELAQQGHAVHFGTMLFHTVDLYCNETPKALANILRTICQGMKVCIEIVLMAADAGLVSEGETVVAVSGTGRGADTAVVAVAATSTHLLDLHITEIICKPLQTKQFPGPPPPPEADQ
ncbi:MAG: pyruvate kinase alpha/beta domain-containing protein [Dehalococcoidales bacterium]|nr:pyruvate kinase alpha/beta domain-containing protein [Dehalococcoidales bacterium]